MRKLMFSKLLSGVLVIAGLALFIFVGKHVFATPNATGGADNQTKDRGLNVPYLSRMVQSLCLKASQRMRCIGTWVNRVRK